MPENSLLTKEERRARREAKRAKQRELNLGRAEKMHKARIEFEQQIEPPVLAPHKASKKKTSQFHVGCSGWFYWHWRDHIYLNLPSKVWF